MTDHELAEEAGFDPADYEPQPLPLEPWELTSAGRLYTLLTRLTAGTGPLEATWRKIIDAESDPDFWRTYGQIRSLPSSVHDDVVRLLDGEPMHLQDLDWADKTLGLGFHMSDAHVAQQHQASPAGMRGIQMTALALARAVDQTVGAETVHELRKDLFDLIQEAEAFESHPEFRDFVVERLKDVDTAIQLWATWGADEAVVRLRLLYGDILVGEAPAPEQDDEKAFLRKLMHWGGRLNRVAKPALAAKELADGALWAIEKGSDLI